MGSKKASRSRRDVVIGAQAKQFKLSLSNTSAVPITAFGGRGEEKERGMFAFFVDNDRRGNVTSVNLLRHVH